MIYSIPQGFQTSIALLKKDEFILDDDDEHVQKELTRRTAVRHRADQSKDAEKDRTDKAKKVSKKEKGDDGDNVEEKEKEIGKWQSTHQELAEKRT